MTATVDKFCFGGIPYVEALIAQLTSNVLRRINANILLETLIKRFELK